MSSAELPDSDMSDVEPETVMPEPVSAQAFYDLLRTYLGNDVQRIEGARDTGAGWEIWLQVELCMFVRWEMAGDIVRENPYGGKTKSRADFTLNKHQQKGLTLVEIKTNLSGESAFDFVRRVAVDFEKQLDAPKTTRTLVYGIWVGANPSKGIGSGEVISVIEVVAGRIYLLRAGVA